MLHRIASDELRHAVLAYRALRWLTLAHGPIARTAAVGALAKATERAQREPEDELRRGVLDAVVRPAMAAAMLVATLVGCGDDPRRTDSSAAPPSGPDKHSTV